MVDIDPTTHKVSLTPEESEALKNSPEDFQGCSEVLGGVALRAGVGLADYSSTMVHSNLHNALHTPGVTSEQRLAFVAAAADGQRLGRMLKRYGTEQIVTAIATKEEGEA